MDWAIFGSAFVISFILIVILGEHLRQRRKLRMREILQKERIAAMEKGVTLPELENSVFDEDRRSGNVQEQYQRKVEWFRFTSLSIGLLLVFGGIGMVLAFHFSIDPGFRELSTIGIIPFMAGLGLLLFYLMTRSQGD